MLSRETGAVMGETKRFEVLRTAGYQYVAHGAAGRAAFGHNDVCRGPVNVAVIRLKKGDRESNSSFYTLSFTSRYP